MAHEEWLEKAAIYASGALDGAELSTFEAHLGAGCAICTAHVRETREALVLMHRTLTPMAPSAAVKDRLLNEISREKSSPAAEIRPGGRRWHVLTGTIAAGIIGLVIGAMYYRTYYEPRYTLYISVINLLRDPATRDHQMYGAGPTPQARGRFLWNESGEGHIFATNLPAAPEGKMYAVWTISLNSAPRFVGTIKTDATGQGGLHINVGRSEKPIETFAVTLEPEGTTAAPSGPIVLVSKQS